MKPPGDEIIDPIDGGEGHFGGLIPGWWRGPFPVLLIALWFGLVAGLLELTFLVTRAQVFENGAWMRSPHSVWMVPVSNLLLAAAGGVFLCLLARARPRWGRRLVVGTLVALACLGQLLLIRGLNLFTCVLIAAGLARQLTPVVIARWPRFLSLVRRSLPSLLGVVVALVGFSFARDSFARHRAIEGRPEVSGPAPNILLIVLDTVRADRLSLYGYDRDTTPNLARLARRGVRFDRARSTAPWTLPSHASMFTGRWPHELEVERHFRLDATYPTLAEFLRDRGYATVGVVANQFFCGSGSGLGRGFTDYRVFSVTPGEILRSSTLGWLLAVVADRTRVELVSRFQDDVMSGVSLEFRRKDAKGVNQEFLDWLEGHDGRPFFAFLNYFDAHDPYLVPEGTRKHFGKAPRSRAEIALLRDWQKLDYKTLGPEAIELASDSYDDCIAALDRELGVLFDELTRRGVLERTMVIITSDHGEQFGEHGGFRHAASLYGSEVHVPLLIFAPEGVPAGRVVRTPVSLRDLPATVVDLLGWQDTSPFPGSSLARTWETQGDRGRAPADPPLSELGMPDGPSGEKFAKVTHSDPLKAIVDEGKVYIRHAGGREELYDIEADPTESLDLSTSAGSGPILTSPPPGPRPGPRTMSLEGSGTLNGHRDQHGCIVDPST